MATFTQQQSAANRASSMGSITSGSGKNVTNNSVIISSPSVVEVGEHNTNNEYSAAFYYSGVTIPQGATIDSAYFEVNSNDTYNAGANTINYLISAQAADNAAALAGTNGDLRASVRPRTTADVTLNATNMVTNTWYSSPDMKAVIQEVVNRAGWASGNAMVILMDTKPDSAVGEWQIISCYGLSPTRAPKLTINYTVGGGSSGVEILRRRANGY